MESASWGDQHSFKKLSLRRFPKLERRESGEEKFWKKFQFPIVVKESAAVASVHFAGSVPHDFAVTSGSRVQVYSSATNQVKKTISRFKEAAYSGCFRHDGRLLAAGSEEGVVKVFDVNSQAILRQCKGHSKPAKAVQFSVDGLKLVSGSDDTSLRHWDLSTGTCVQVLREHEDYVHSVLPSPSSSDLVLSSSYDHTLRLWDLRAGTTILTMDHGAPVEAILMFPSGGTCLSAGSNFVKVWDILSGGRLLMAFSNHQKTITSICFDGSCQRLLSAGLDKQLKVYSVEDYHVLHSMTYPAPILSVAMSPSDSHLVVGMTTRLLSIKHRPHREDPTPLTLSAPTPRGGTYRYFVRGKTYKPASDEYVVPLPRKQRLQSYEKFLKKFQYKNALDAALAQRGPGRGLTVYSLLQELARRDGLSVALSGRNEEELFPILKYLARFMTHPQYAPLLLDVCTMVIEIYARTLPESPPTRAMFNVLKVKVDRETQFQRHAFELLGTLDTLLTASTAIQRHQVAATSQLPSEESAREATATTGSVNHLPLGESTSMAVMSDGDVLASGTVTEDSMSEEMKLETEPT